ncbi:hypothetical protein XENOCAPTIV_025822 [Xenoophorus captivus]|uniref:Uncharacterized protein n=1 Tax=Xenoophorus captivus TaxID=1517983 RepID=A0ABV0QBK0_9TELE
MLSPGPQNTCGPVGKTPMNPRAPRRGYRAGPVFEMFVMKLCRLSIPGKTFIIKLQKHIREAGRISGPLKSTVWYIMSQKGCRKTILMDPFQIISGFLCYIKFN